MATTDTNPEPAAAAWDVPPHEVYTALLAHELRTPVTAIHGFLELLRDDDVLNDPETVREYLALVRVRAAELAQRISELTTFTRLMAGEPPVPPTPGLGAETLPAMVRGLAAGRPVEIDCAAGAEWPAVDGDRLRLVLSILLDNAWRFGPAGATVRVAAGTGASPAMFSVRVTNEGAPIPMELREAIFAPFRQAEPPNQRTHGGFGLGLAVARRAAESAGGSLTLEAEPATTFHLRLPLAPARDQAGQSDPNRLDGVDAQTLRAIQDIRALRRALEAERDRNHPLLLRQRERERQRK